MKNSPLMLLLSLAVTSAYADETSPFDIYSLSLRELQQVKIATGTSIALEKAPAVATLINAKDIKAMGALTIDEVLEAVPGLHIIPSTLNRLNPVYSFRGIYAGQNPQVLFLLNGYRMIGDLASGGLTYLGQMNANNVARIEIVRGPGSAIYGADAYAGVINIITKTAEEVNGLHLGVRGGVQATRNLWLQYGGKLNEDWLVSLNWEYFKRDANNNRVVETDFQTTFDQLFGSDSSLAPSYLDDRMTATTYNFHLNNQHWAIGLDGYFKHDSGVGAGAAQVIDHQGFDDYDQYLFSLAYQRDDVLVDWRFTAQGSYFYTKLDTHFEIFPAGSVLPVGNDGNIFTAHDGVGCLTTNIPGIGCITRFSDGVIGNPGVESKTPMLAVTAHYDGWSDHQLRFNIGHKREEMLAFGSKNTGPGVLDAQTLNGQPNPLSVDGQITDVTGKPFIFIPNKTRIVRFLSMQDIWTIQPNWTLTAGLRYDDHSDFGSTANPRLALVWQSSATLVSKLLYGEAFRAPSFGELYFQNNPVTLGNDQLKPETIKTTELSFNYKLTADLSTNLSLYHYATKDMIEFVVNSQGTRTAQNNKRLTGQGFELESTWQVTEQWLFSANYAYHSTKNDSDDRQVEYVPKQQFYLDMRWQLTPNWQLSSQLNWVLDRKRGSGDERQAIDDYNRLNVTLRRVGSGGKLSSEQGSKQGQWEFAVSLKNGFNQRGREPSDGKIPDDHLLHDRRLYLEWRCQL